MEQRYQTILVGVDGSSQAEDAYKKAVEVARRNNGRVVVAYIVDQPMSSFMGYAPLNESVLDHEKELGSVLLEELENYAKSIDFTNVETVLAFGSAKQMIGKELPEKFDANLIMVGQSGLNAAERFITGSVANYVIREARCDVLIVSPKEEEK